VITNESHQALAINYKGIIRS